MDCGHCLGGGDSGPGHTAPVLGCATVTSEMVRAVAVVTGDVSVWRCGWPSAGLLGARAAVVVGSVGSTVVVGNAGTAGSRVDSVVSRVGSMVSRVSSMVSRVCSGGVGVVHNFIFIILGAWPGLFKFVPLVPTEQGWLTVLNVGLRSSNTQVVEGVVMRTKGVANAFRRLSIQLV